MSDINMSSFPAVTDAEYVYIELADGSQGKISKDCLAKIVHPYFGIVYKSDIIDCDTLKEEIKYAGYRWANSPLNDIAILEVLPYTKDWIVQRFTHILLSETWLRTFISGTTWTGWRKISFTS